MSAFVDVEADVKSVVDSGAQPPIDNATSAPKAVIYFIDPAPSPRSPAPGTHWEYKTGETNLIGTLVSRATGQRLSDYAKRESVAPADFAGDWFWTADVAATNVGVCCLSLRLSDYSRMGLFAMGGGKGQVPDGWFAAAGSSQADTGIAGVGYGYQWWVYAGGNYGAQGIFGQAITIFPEQNVVIAAVSNWPVASSRKLTAERLAFFQKLAVGAR